MFTMYTSVSIPGIHCASCAVLIRDVSSGFPSIKSVDVDIGTKRIGLEHGDDLDMEEWTQEIESLGDTYRVYPIAV